MVSKTLSGGDKLKRKLADIAKSMGGGSVSVGFMSGSTYPDGTPVAAVAFWNEYGHGGQFPAPPRPFFRRMIAKESPGWAVTMARLAKATNYNGVQVLGIMGNDIKGALQQSIIDLTDPALSPTTLMLRKLYGNDTSSVRARDVLHAQELVAQGEQGATGTQAKPLIHTGHLINSVDFEVKP